MIDPLPRIIPGESARILDRGVPPTDGNVAELKVEPSDLDRAIIRDALVAHAVSLANTGGGWLLVETSAGQSRGSVKRQSELRVLVERIQGLLLNEAKPPLPTSWSIVRDEERARAVLWIPAAAPLVLTARGEAITRREGNVFPMSPDELLDRLGFLRGYDATPVPASLDDLDPAAIARYFELTNDVKTEVELSSIGLSAEQLSSLYRRRLVRTAIAPHRPHVRSAGSASTISEELAPTVVGLLLLGRPQAIAGALPGARIFVTRYRGTDRAEILETVSLHQTVPGLVQDTVQTIARLARRQVRAAGLYRIDEPEYPEDILYELVVNALAHRRYDVDSPVTVDVFFDRIEIRNPGAPLPALLHQEWPGGLEVRNPRLVDNLVTLGLMRGNGSGLARIAARLREANLPPLETHSSREQTLVILRGLAVSDRIARVLRGSIASLTDKERRVITLAAARPITNRDIRDELSVSIATASRLLTELSARGILSREGNGRSTKYSVRVEWPAPA